MTRFFVCRCVSKVKTHYSSCRAVVGPRTKMDVNKHGGQSPPRVPRADHRVRRVVKFRNPHSVGKDITSEIRLNSLSLWDNYEDSTAYLYDYLLELSREKLYLNDKDIYKRLSDFICRVHSFLTNLSSSGPSTLVASLIHYTIMIVVKTVHVFVCLRICQRILDTGIIIRTPAIQKQMEELISLATYLERCILHLEKLVCKIFCFGNKSPDFYLFRQSLFRVSNINYILDYLSDASHKLATVFTTKMHDRLKYFNWLAWSISAICIGDLAQALVNGKSSEEFLRTCLWSVCVGSSSLVLQIPSYESKPLQQLLTHHDKEHKRLCRMFQLQTANGKLIK